jgi:hypothetical protein
VVIFLGQKGIGSKDIWKPAIRKLCIYLSKCVRIRSYFSKTKGDWEQRYLGNTELDFANRPYVARKWNNCSSVLNTRTVMNLRVP